MSDISDIMNYLPTAGANKSIAVGFENIDALAPLKVLLDDFAKKTYENEKKLDEQDEKNQKNRDKKIEEIWNSVAKNVINEIKNQNKLTEKQIDVLEKQSKIIEETNDKISESIDVKEKTDFKLIKQRLKRIANATFDVLDKHLDKAIELGNVYTDIESNGVFLKNGFKDLGEATNKLGMTHQELAGYLKKTSPLIAKLNGSMGNGIKSFQTAVSSIDDSLNLTNKEKVAIFENVLTNMSPDQLMKMSQEQMNVEINKTAKEMKMLSMATGKSVDLINQENAQRESTQRQQVWKRTHQASFNALKALGLDKDQEMMDYIMSGGTKATANILTRMQNDPFMQKVLPQMIRMANSNKLDMGSLSSLYAQNKHLVGYKSAYANRASFDQGIMGAAATSDYFQNATLNDTFGEAFMKMNLNGDMASQYFSPARADANAALGNHIGLTRAMGRYDSSVLEALGGGENGVKNATGVGGWLYNKGAGIINGYNNTIGKWFGGTLSGLGASTIAVNKEQIFSAAVDRFAWAVNLMIGSQLFKSILGKGKGIVSKAGSAGAKVLGGAKKVGVGALNLLKKGGVGAKNLLTKDLGNIGKLGTIAGAAINIGMDVKRANEIGAENLLEEKRKNGLQGWDWINPYAWGQQIALHTGVDKAFGWLGEKAADMFYSPSKPTASVKPYTSGSITTPTSKPNEEDKQNGTEMLQCMKSTNDKIENMCMLMEENNKISYQTRIDTKTKGEHQN